ncbi:MAG: sulfatase-like hydrolase/transferase, partial [Pseudomonadota bacterium]
PFFLYVPYSMPHTPIFRSDAFIERSLGGRYGDVIEELDWSVGKIVSALDELGLRGQTLVLFTSDNGPWLLMDSHGGTAGLLRQGKATTFEGGMRVPMIVSRPGWVTPGTVSDLGSTLDVFATVAALAGVAAPATDGFDLSPVLRGSGGSPRDEFAYYRGSELRAYRMGPWKLHLVTEGAYNRPPPRVVHEQPLLYHLGEDPGERFDVADQYPEIVAELKAAIARHRASTPVAAPIMDKRLEGGA